MKRNGPEEQSLGRNFSNLLYVMVSSDGSDGRIKLFQLETEINNAAGTDKGSSLVRYLYTDQRPNADNAWLIGEALYACGVKWMNGLVALYVAGRLEDFVSTVASFLHPADQQEPSLADCTLLGRLLSRLDLLVLLFPFDLEPEIAPLYARVDNGKDALFQARPFIQRIASSPDEAQDYEQWFVQREAEKRNWLQYLPLREAFNCAFRNRKSALKNSRLPEVLRGLNVIAKSRELEWAVKKMAISIILRAWLNDLAYEDNDALAEALNKT